MFVVYAYRELNDSRKKNVILTTKYFVFIKI